MMFIIRAEKLSRLNIQSVLKLYSSVTDQNANEILPSRESDYLQNRMSLICERII